MNKNVFVKVFFTSVVWTAACLGLAAYAADKAQQKDPAIADKLVQHVQKTSNVHISLNSSNRDYIPTEDRWTFTSPSEEIVITTVNGDVEIVSTKTGSLTVFAKGLRHKSHSKLLNTENSEKSESLSQSDEKQPKELEIQISVPENFPGVVKVKTVNGDVEVKSATLNSLEAETINGDTEIEKSTIKLLTQKSVSGDVEVENKTRGDMRFQTVSGDVRLKLAQSEKMNFQLETVSGSLKNSLAVDPKGDATVFVKTVSGDVEIRKL